MEINNSQVKYLSDINFLIFKNDNMIGYTLETKGQWEEHIEKIFSVLVLKTHYCIDIGANIGMHTVSLSKKALHVYAFEPQLQNFTLLYKNVTNNNCKNVQLFPAACGSDFSFTLLPVIDLDKPLNTGDISLNIPIENNSISSHATMVVKLDNVVNKPINLIKIDVQGFELEVLKGMDRILTHDKPFLIIELEDHTLKRYNLTSINVVEFMHKYDYIPILIKSDWPVDYLFVHSCSYDIIRNNEKLIFSNISNYSNIISPSLNNCSSIKESIIVK